METPKPVITGASRAYNFTNEAGLGGTTRLLKNIVGLWIVQECRRTWLKEGHELAYDDLARLASEARPLRSMINPADPIFYKPDDMPQKVADFCARTGQKIPKTPGEIIRCLYESLALLYQVTLQEVQEITGQTASRLHIVGGGSKSDLLNQLAANATQIPVLAGPVEATAIGNLLIQALALGHIKSSSELREIVRNSFPAKAYQPQDQLAWTAASKKFHALRTTPQKS
jgi:rhamnulokinase